MSKKSKKFDAPTEAPSQVETNAPTATEATEAPAKVGIPKAPSLYVENNGVQYKFTRFPLPKKCAKNEAGEGQIVVDGNEIPFWTTASKGWAKEDAVIEYAWFTLPIEGNPTGYITLDYNTAALSIQGMEFTSGEGKANRDDPKRLPRDPDKEANRIAQFQAKMAEKKAATPTTPEGTEQPTEQSA